MTGALQLGGHQCGWDGLTCQTRVHPIVGHPCGWPKLAFQMGPVETYGIRVAGLA